MIIFFSHNSGFWHVKNNLNLEGEIENMSQLFFPYAKQSITEEDRQATAEALKGEQITRGPLVQEFEQTLADYCQVPYAVAFNSGTSALMAAYFAAHLTSSDRVISSPNTFIATIGAALNKQSRLQLIDIDRSTGNLHLNGLKKQVHYTASRGRPFIVPVHFSGLAVNMAALDHQICHPDTIVIEDAAHALGSFYPTGEKVGSCAYSDLTIFSFHPAKTLTTGEGGMVTTKDAALYHRLQVYRDNGIERAASHFKQQAVAGYYEVQNITGNFHLTSFQAALGLSQFQRLEHFIVKRRQLVKRYRQNLKGISHVKLFTDAQDDYTAFHLFVVQVNFSAYRTTRAAMMERLKEKGIGTQVHYIPLYHHPVLARHEEEKTHYPEMEQYYQEALSLPLYADLIESDVDTICDVFVSMLRNK